MANSTLGWNSISIDEFEKLIFDNDVIAYTQPSDTHIVLYYDRAAYDRGEVKPVAKLKCKAGWSDWNEFYRFD